MAGIGCWRTAWSELDAEIVSEAAALAIQRAGGTVESAGKRWCVRLPVGTRPCGACGEACTLPGAIPPVRAWRTPCGLVLWYGPAGLVVIRDELLGFLLEEHRDAVARRGASTAAFC